MIPIATCTAILVCMAAMLQGAAAEVREVGMEGGVRVEIAYPESVILGEIFAVTILVENGGWEDKQDITFEFEPGAALVPSTGRIVIDRIAEGGTVGRTVEFTAADVVGGRYFLNIAYSQVLVRDNQVPQEPFVTNMAIPILVKEVPRVVIRTSVPESIFADAEFPFEVEVVSHDIDLHNLQVRIVPPDDIWFRGETMHLFSDLEKGRNIRVVSQIITPQETIGTQYGVPFGVVVTYEDHEGEARTISETVMLLMRPRTFLEMTGDGGIWVGGFFIAPYVSIGTIVGIPASAVLSMLLRRSQRRRRCGESE